MSRYYKVDDSIFNQLINLEVVKIIRENPNLQLNLTGIKIITSDRNFKYIHEVIFNKLSHQNIKIIDIVDEKYIPTEIIEIEF